MTDTVGLAMIARNGAETMRRALDPFVDLVEEISIVLGGDSTDETGDIAAEYATVIEPFAGPLDKDGRLMDFAAARNQSLAQLSTGWAIVIDCDDVWEGVENLGAALEIGKVNEAALLLIAYYENTRGGRQGRIMRRDAGHYVGAVHEYFRLNNGYRALAVDGISVRQVRDPAILPERLRQNVAIAEAMEPTPRGLAHLVNDYEALRKYEKALLAGLDYLAMTGSDEDEAYNFPGEKYTVLCHMSTCLLQMEQFSHAYRMASEALAILPHGYAWALVAEAACQWANVSDNKKSLAELALFAADRALEAGYELLTAIHTDIKHVQLGPYHTKANAWTVLGERKKALAAAEIGLRLDPDYEALQDLKKQLAR